MKRGWGLATIAALAFLCVGTLAPAAPAMPAMNGRRVVDEAGILSPASEAALTLKLAGLETITGRQVVIATLPSLQGSSIEDYGYRLGRSWGVGSRERNDGLLLIVAPKERKVRIEVGYGLEGVMTDALASVIIHTTILPRFRQGDLEGGVVAGADAIVDQLHLPDAEAKAIAGKARSAQRGRPWWIRPVISIAIMLIMTAMTFVWSFVSGLFSGWGGLRPREIRRRQYGLVDWSGGSYGGGGSYIGGGYSGGGGSFGGGGASGSW